MQVIFKMVYWRFYYRGLSGHKIINNHKKFKNHEISIKNHKKTCIDVKFILFP